MILKRWFFFWLLILNLFIIALLYRINLNWAQWKMPWEHWKFFYFADRKYLYDTLCATKVNENDEQKKKTHFIANNIYNNVRHLWRFDLTFLWSGAGQSFILFSTFLYSSSCGTEKRKCASEWRITNQNNDVSMHSILVDKIVHFLFFKCFIFSTLQTFPLGTIGRVRKNFGRKKKLKPFSETCFGELNVHKSMKCEYINLWRKEKKNMFNHKAINVL